MTKKRCFRCQEVKPSGEFYVHGGMADGRLNKCKSCCRADAVANRLARLDYYRQYDRERLNTERRRSWVAERQRRYRLSNPKKNAARAAVNRAIRSGSMVKGRCEFCGNEDVDAHHDDYARPLDVRWLCRVHHMIEHGRYVTK